MGNQSAASLSIRSHVKLVFWLRRRSQRRSVHDPCATSAAARCRSRFLQTRAGPGAEALGMATCNAGWGVCSGDLPPIWLAAPMACTSAQCLCSLCPKADPTANSRSGGKACRKAIVLPSLLR